MLWNIFYTSWTEQLIPPGTVEVNEANMSLLSGTLCASVLKINGSSNPSISGYSEHLIKSCNKGSWKKYGYSDITSTGRKERFKKCENKRINVLDREKTQCKEKTGKRILQIWGNVAGIGLELSNLDSRKRIERREPRKVAVRKGKVLKPVRKSGFHTHLSQLHINLDELTWSSCSLK